MFQKMIDDQYRRPSGWLGRWIGRKMAQQHIPENEWTVHLLNPQPEDRILEIGFGPGIAIERVAPHLKEGHIAGVDFSQTMVKAARKRNAKAVEAGHVDLRYGDVLHLPFSDGSFDKVYSIHSIYFWPRPVDGLREIYRVLKTGGTLILTILPKEKWGTGDPDKPVGTPECRPYSGEELREMLAEIGYVDIQIVVEEKAVSPSNFSLVARR